MRKLRQREVSILPKTKKLVSKWDSVLVNVVSGTWAALNYLVMLTKCVPGIFWLSIPSYPSSPTTIKVNPSLHHPKIWLFLADEHYPDQNLWPFTTFSLVPRKSFYTQTPKHRCDLPVPVVLVYQTSQFSSQGLCHLNPVYCNLFALLPP